MIELIETLQQELMATVQSVKQASVVRQIHFPQAQKIIKVAIGMRRSGKTYLLYQLINQLLDAGVSAQQILMINFEDDRLVPMTAKEMGQLLDAFYSLYPENHNRKCYILLDEVQNVADWHLVVRRFFDSKNVELYLTGSSAKLLSKEIATSLRGRSLSVEVWPYSFLEYLEAHNISVPTKPFGQKSIDLYNKYLNEYFKKGGFPALSHLSNNEWRDMLQGYIDAVILRDIVERYNVSNIELLKYLIITLLKNAATQFSITKFYNDIKSQGYKVNKDTLYTYMNYIEDAFLVFSVPIYSESERQKKNIPKKIYCVDNGLIHLLSLGINEQKNKYLENQIYVDLRRQGKKVYFYKTKEGYEIDFVAIDTDGSRELIQVCVDAKDKETSERESRALLSAEKELNIKGRIITLKDYLQNFVK